MKLSFRIFKVCYMFVYILYNPKIKKACILLEYKPLCLNFVGPPGQRNNTVVNSAMSIVGFI